MAIGRPMSVLDVSITVPSDALNEVSQDKSPLRADTRHKFGGTYPSCSVSAASSCNVAARDGALRNL